MKYTKIRALVLLSGGLDSILVVKILQEQGVEIAAVSFESYFFNGKKAKIAAEALNIPLKTVDFSEEHLQMVKKPKYGYGRGMNPCLDCHLLMLKKAKQIMEKENYNFIATGEVLGERPMSQNRKALGIIEKELSLTGFLLRPLSAKLLPKTVPEEKGWVKREKLFAISGRSRRRQMALAKKWQIQFYPTPAGGCLLTDPEFSKRLRELFEKYPESGANDIELLKIGRHFWSDKTKIVVGRDHEENLKIKSLAQRSDVLIELRDYPGPTTLVRDYGKRKISETVLEMAKGLTKKYSRRARDQIKIDFIVNQIANKE